MVNKLNSNCQAIQKSSVGPFVARVPCLDLTSSKPTTLDKKNCVLSNWFIQNKADKMKICYKRLFTVPFQVCSITGKVKPFQSGSVFTSMLS